MLQLISIYVLSILVTIASANTEKAIFLAPEKQHTPVEHPTLDDLNLQVLTPAHPSLRTHLHAEFPGSDTKHGLASWFLLDQLREGQRYEVRVCWAATQPTSFRLETFEIPVVFEHPDLITSLAEYSDGQTSPETSELNDPSIYASANPDGKKANSILFLQIFAAADYYTTNKTLMENVPPVFVDIILDPFVFNVLPKSLLPTVSYIIILAISSWFLSSFISAWLHKVTRGDPMKKNI